MFEEKAKEYVIKKHNIDITKQPVDFSLRCEFAEDFTDFQRGAEFGYNKAKEEMQEQYCKVKQEFNDNQFNAIMKLKDEFTNSLTYAKSIVKDLLDNSDEYAKQRAREFLEENK